MLMDSGFQVLSMTFSNEPFIPLATSLMHCYQRVHKRRSDPLHFQIPLFLFLYLFPQVLSRKIAENLGLFPEIMHKQFLSLSLFIRFRIRKGNNK